MEEQKLIEAQGEIRGAYYGHMITYKHAVKMAHRYAPTDPFYVGLTLAALRDEHMTRWKIRLMWVSVFVLVLLMVLILIIWSK